MISKLYKIRFELFFFSQLLILFGSLITPALLFQETLMPILFSFNIISGIILISKKKMKMKFFIFLFFLSLVLLGINVVQNKEDDVFSVARFGIYFLFYAVVTVEIINQIWKAKTADKNVIIGLMSGYLSVGLIAFFIFASIELYEPGSFKGLLTEGIYFSGKIDSLLYYSYITVLTIGYGDIIPITAMAQKASVLSGLMGQFYIVIVTAVVVEKYFISSHINEEKNNKE